MTRQHDPNNAATDPNAAAQQDQIKRDKEALQEQARRVDESLPSGREAATDPNAAAVQDQVKRDHDALEESRRRVEESRNRQ